MRKALVLLLLCLGLSLLAQKATDRFTTDKIACELLEDSGSFLDERLLDQPYSYLGKGGQSYVFVSEDGHYVLKVFRASQLHRARLLHRHEKVERLKNELNSTMQSYQLAFAHLREETGLVGIHFDKNIPLNKPLILVDKIQIQHTIDPNTIPFVIQKRAMPIEEIQSQEGLESLFALLQKKRALGIYDPDANLMKNFGVLGARIIQIDPGRLTTEPASERKLHSSAREFQHVLQGANKRLATDFQTYYEEYERDAI